jgi:hypothetical protein
MMTAFDSAELGGTGLTARRMALSASYWPGKKTVYKAVDNGVTAFFSYGFDLQMIRALRDLFKTGRDKFVVIPAPTTSSGLTPASARRSRNGCGNWEPIMSISSCFSAS